MKTIFDPATKDELLQRLDSLSPESTREWGKMSPSQAMEHTARALDMATGRQPMKHHILGKLLSWIFWKKFIGEEPFPRNSPTGPDFIIKDEPDFDAARARLRELIEAIHTMGPTGVDGNVHGFFGPLTGEQWGITQFKHVDHHLRQFGK